MRHLTALRLVDGGWHYVSAHRRRGTYPIGYCADHKPHATEDEARECYASYQRDNLRLDGECEWTRCHQPDCPNPAKKTARVPGKYRVVAMCDEHFDRETATRLLGLDQPMGDAWVS